MLGYGQPQILPNILLFLLQYRLAHPRAENCHVVTHLARANRTGNQFLPDGLRVQPCQLADIFPQSDFSARIGIAHPVSHHHHNVSCLKRHSQGAGFHIRQNAYRKRICADGSHFAVPYNIRSARPQFFKRRLAAVQIAYA